MPGIATVGALPGWGPQQDALGRRIYWSQDNAVFAPGGLVIDGTNSRDPGNLAVNGSSNSDVLRAGLIMGKITATGKYANSTLGQLAIGYGGTPTSLSLPLPSALEIIRRIGTSGNFKLTGPAYTGGTVRTMTVAFSAINSTTGVATVTPTAAGAVSAVNQVEALPVVDSSGTGTFSLTIEGVTTGAITYSATPATLVSNINTALNNVFGTSAIVASGSTLAALILTFSGTGYAARPINGHVTATLNSTLTATGTTIGGSTTVGASTTTTLGVVAVAATDGVFVAGSLIQPTDGSETPRCLITKEDGIEVVDRFGNNYDAQFPEALVGGAIESFQIIDYSTDPGTQSWIKAQLRAVGIGYIFRDDF